MSKMEVIHQHFLVNSYPFRGKTFIQGEGVYLFDETGKKYLDLMGNYGVNIFGYNHLQISKELCEQVKLLSCLHGGFANDVRAKAAEKLVKRCGGKLEKVFFSNSGAEAVEAALKFAVLATGKKRIVAAKGGYHGKTFGALSVTFGEKYRSGFDGLLQEVEFVPFGNIEKMVKIVNEETAAVILEPIQGERGVIIPFEGYLKKVEKMCRKKKVVFILDEVQTGVGRTGYFLAGDKEEIEADIVCLGKGLAGGIAVGATLVTKEIGEKIPKAVHTSTFGGNPLACRGILAVLELVDEKMLGRIRFLGERFLEGLKLIKSEKIKEIRGRGLMIGMEVKGDRNQILKNLQERGILACPAGEKVVRFLPPYIISEKEIKRAVKILREVF